MTAPAPAYRALAIGVIVSIGFTGLIWLLAGRLAAVPHAPDAGASWYYWKLIEPTPASRLTAWGFYLLHQIAFWAVIAYAQRTAARTRPRYTDGLRRANVLALAINGFFVALHVVQTHIWYDGLAQDVSIWSALGSVVVLLVWVLLMENPRRGLFFGKPIGFPRRVTAVARRYHGYYFAWATVYTLWYHPVEAASGHLIGFLYMFLLLLQGSLFFTRVHVNRWWTLVLEVSVLAHGTLVAIMQGNRMWPMFAFGFGFGGIFVITQMHGLSWPRWVRGAVPAAYVAGVLAVYGALGWERFSEVVRIPLIDYAAVFALAGLIGGGIGLVRLFRPAAPAATSNRAGSPSCQEQLQLPPTEADVPEARERRHAGPLARSGLRGRPTCLPPLRSPASGHRSDPESRANQKDPEPSDHPELNRNSTQGAEAGWMRLDENYGGRRRTHPALTLPQPTARLRAD